MAIPPPPRTVGHIAPPETLSASAALGVLDSSGERGTPSVPATTAFLGGRRNGGCAHAVTCGVIRRRAIGIGLAGGETKMGTTLRHPARYGIFPDIPADIGAAWESSSRGLGEGAGYWQFPMSSSCFRDSCSVRSTSCVNLVISSSSAVSLSWNFPP